jgi:hypothetical protein
MAKKQTTQEHHVYLLLDPQTGLSIAYSSDLKAADDRDFFESHLGNKMSIIKIPYAYDSLPLETKAGIVAQLKGQEQP